MQRWTSKQLLEEWRARRNEAAFRILHDRCWPLVVGYLRRRMERRYYDMADDVALTVLMDLRAAQEEIVAIEPWLITVAERRLRDFLRRNYAEKRGLKRPTIEVDAALQAAQQDARKAAPRELLDQDTPDELACRSEQNGTARKLVNRLTGRQREVMVMVGLERRSVSATAEALGLSRASVRDYLDKAKAKLMQMHELRELADVLPPSCRAQLPT